MLFVEYVICVNMHFITVLGLLFTFWAVAGATVSILGVRVTGAVISLKLSPNSMVLKNQPLPNIKYKTEAHKNVEILKSLY